MDIMDMLVNISSIGSFIVAIIALFIANDVKKEIRKTNQTIKGNDISNSTVIQDGGYNSKGVEK